MAGKKRKLKKELKRKLRKETKKKGMNAAESKVEKQVLDKQTLQQIMMAQMMSSRDRIRKGEDTSWITTQNQANADKIQAQQKINALKAEKKEWEMKAKNIKENEQYKEIEEKLKQEIEEHKKAVEQAQKIIPLEEEIRNLKTQKAELEQKLNDPVNQKKIEIENIKNYIKHMNENLAADDPDFKEKSDNIAKLTAKLNKYKQQQELGEELDKLKTELKRKESERKTAMAYLRKEFPEELKGVQYNDKDLTEKLQTLIDNTVDKIAENETKLKKFKEQKQIGEEYAKVAIEFKRNEAEMKSDMEYIRQQIPDFLKGVQWNAKDRDEKILEAKHKAAIELVNMNKQLEILKETSEEMKILNQVKANRDMYEENFKKKHPLFNPIYKAKLSAYGENITQADITNAFIDSYNEYSEQLKDNIAVISKADEELNKQPGANSEDDNPDYKIYNSSDINNEYVSSSSDSDYISQNDNSKDDES